MVSSFSPSRESRRAILIATCALLGLAQACGNRDVDEAAVSHPANATRPTPVPTPPSEATPPPTGTAADLLGTYVVKHCSGVANALEPAYQAVVAKVAAFCNEQNEALSKAGRVACAPNSCTLRTTTTTGGPEHTLSVSVGASSLGALSLQFSIQAARRDPPDFSDGNLFSCMGASIYASTRLNARELLRHSLWEGDALCGVPRR